MIITMISASTVFFCIKMGGYMWKSVIVAVMFPACWCLSSARQLSGDGLPEVICRIFGLVSQEELSEELVAEFRRLSECPLRINEAGKDELFSSVLFTQYQAASVWDYRCRTGDILSALELSLVDGFSAGAVEDLSRFLCFDVRHQPGRPSPRARTSHKLYLRPEIRSARSKGDGMECRGALRYAAEFGRKVSVRLGASYPSSSDKVLPADCAFHVSCRGKDMVFLAGDIHMRFGQGLAAWTGASFTGLPSLRVLKRNAGGLCVPDSYSGGTAVSGFGCKARIKNLECSAILACPLLKKGVFELVPAVNLAWFGRRVRLGHTVLMRSGDLAGAGKGGLSQILSAADFSMCLKGTDIYGEFALDWMSFAPSAILGCAFPVGERVRCGGAVRYYSPLCVSGLSGSYCSVSGRVNETGMSLVCEGYFGERRHFLSASADFACHEADRKTVSAGDWQFRTAVGYTGQSGGQWSYGARYYVRLKGNVSGPGLEIRNELRLDVRHTAKVWEIATRWHMQYGRDFSWLFYAEGCLRFRFAELYLRQGFFKADNWADRIYAYERDFPLSFSIPAYYGRGMWTALYGTADFCSWCGVGLKAFFRACPWGPAEKRKPGSAGLKLLLTFRF